MVKTRDGRDIFLKGLGFLVAFGTGIGCGADDKNSSGANIITKIETGDKSDASLGSSKGFNADNAESLAAFETTLYPILKSRCGLCHGDATSPRHADPSPYNAHKIAVEAHLISPSAPSSSRLVTRLSVNNHNCWNECPKDAQVILEAIQEWVKKANLTVSTDHLKLTPEVSVKDAAARPLFGGLDGNWVREAENHEGIGKRRFEVVEDQTASQRLILKQNPLANGQTPENTTAEDEPSYSFTIPPGESLSLWLKVKDLQRGRRISYRINGAAQVDFSAPGNITAWTWVQVFDLKPLKPLAGSKNIVITLRDVEVGVDLIALTNKPTFDRSVSENTGVRPVLTFNLQSIANSDAKIYFNFETSADGKTYRLTRPVVDILDNKTIFMKGIYLILNKQFNPQYSTFALVQGEFKGQATISDKTGIVLRKDDLDQFSLGFEEIKSQ